MTLTLKYKDGRVRAFDAVVRVVVDDMGIFARYWTPFSALGRVVAYHRDLKGYSLS